MLDVINRYAHGFVVVPVVLASRRGGLLSRLASGPATASELARALSANAGHLQVVLRLLVSLGWINCDAGGRYTATPALRQEALIPDDVWPLVTADMEAWLRDGSGIDVRPWLDRARARWGVDDPLIADFLDSLLVVPVLVLLTRRGVLKNLAARDFVDLPSGVRETVSELFRTLRWIEGAPGACRLTPPGAFMCERAMNLGLAESYRPMLGAMDRLLFGDAAGVFVAGPDGHETHVDRSINVISSGAQHDRYFAEVEEILISIFSREPTEAQPRYVADMGCGDGTFLKRVYETVRAKTPRGQRLQEHPLTLVGIDLNEASLIETSRTLAGLDHVVVPGDIGNPRQVITDLCNIGVDTSRVLHIRSFLDHDRPYLPPQDRAAVRQRDQHRYVGAYANRQGEAIPAAEVVQNLVEHLARWSGVINDHGLILLEVHCQDPLVVREHLDQSESLYFDALQGFSQQLLVEADAALMAAAEAGLFPHPEYFRKYPGFLPYCRITLNLFERRPYRARLARVEDMAALLHLEAACWPEPMRVGAPELQRRLTTHPAGQWVIELEGKVVAVVYTQRVSTLEALRSSTLATLHTLHEEQGSVVQLISLNVHPEVQHLGLGDQLRDLMLMRCALTGGVRQVAGITRCKEFRGDSLDALARYVEQRDALGRPVDPILQFHHSKGAQFLGVVPAFRPEDHENLGAGVLLVYDLNAPGGILRPIDNAAARLAASGNDSTSRLESALRGLLGPKRQAAFSWTRPLRELGLDSLDLLGFRTVLQEMFAQSLSPTFFFSHPTLRDIGRFFASKGSPGASGDNGSAPRPIFDDPSPTALPSSRTSSIAPITAAADDASAIAIIGMAGRFPGCANLDEYWELLAHGRDAITEVPTDRWDVHAESITREETSGTVVSRFGGFLDQVDHFDPAFFNISPREAKLMDPQQRLLLETHWRALEDAGIDPHRLREAACGIFVGLYSHDYELLHVESGDPGELDAYYATGNSPAIAAGRIAYFLGTRGPALTLDTACSSSLVAIHQAIRSLRSGECATALASGVNLMLSPRLMIAFSKAGMLSPRGRCRTFDAGADGYVRAEGCGVVVLKRLDHALREGDPVLAVLRGSAINQDGASNGLTAPSLTAQEQLLRDALRDARLQPAEVDYIEAHGTGTSLGDPVEFQALQAVYGCDQARTAPLWLGSVKTNIGHAEAAAGIAGLIKVVLAMRHRWLPAHLHFQNANPHVTLDALPARIPTEGTTWQRADAPLRAGVSSFGFSGTNAHVIVEQAPAVREVSPDRLTRSAHALVLSAKSAAALASQATAFAHWLESHRESSLADIGHLAAAGRAHHEYRLACSGRDHAELAHALHEAAANAPHTRPVHAPPRIAFLFTGQGSQYAGMARELSLTEPAFRQALAQCRALLRDELAEPLEELLYPAAGQESQLDETAVTQPALFAIEYALARMWQAWGIHPAAVIGHSVGEFVAACIAGVLSVEDALRLVAARGRLMSALPREGAMIAILGSASQIETIVGRIPPAVAIAACNSPGNIVISGAREPVTAFAREVASLGVKTVPLHVSHAFHSPLMDPMLPAFRDAAARVALRPPQLSLISNLTGELADTAYGQPEYWCRHVRQPVRFQQGMRTLAGLGIDVMLEVGPHPVLTAMGRACVSAEQESAIFWGHTIARGAQDWVELSRTIGALYERGAEIDWRRYHGHRPRPHLALPGHPWQRKRFWFTPRVARDERPPASGKGLRWERIRSAMLTETVWQTTLRPNAGCVRDHRIFGVIIAPAPVLLELVWSAAEAAHLPAVRAVEHFGIQRALTLRDDASETVQVIFARDEGGRIGFGLHSLREREGEDASWVLHAGGQLLVAAQNDARSATAAPAAANDADASRRAMRPAHEVYAFLGQGGAAIGPGAQAIIDVASGPSDASAALEVPADAGVFSPLRLHPVLLDAALQVAAVARAWDRKLTPAADTLTIFAGCERIQLHGSADRNVRADATFATPSTPDETGFVADVAVRRNDGSLVATITKARFQTVHRHQVLPETSSAVSALLHEVAWHPWNDPAWSTDRDASDYLPPIDVVRDELVASHLQRARGTAAREETAARAFDRLSTHFVRRAYHELGWNPEADERVAQEALLARLAIVPPHARLAVRMLEILAEEGDIRRERDDWVVVRPWAETGEPAPDAIAALGECAVEWRILERCASRLADVVRGRCDPLQLLFPEGSLESAARLYEDSTMSRAPNALMRDLAARLAAALPRGRVLRVLEIGAGTGGTTSHLLPALLPVPCEFVFTDVSRLFLERAAAKYRDFPFVHYRLLDIERSPAEQGFAPAQFDLILAANALHATRDMRVTLEHARSLLADGGFLALIEGIRPARWIDLVFGQIEGWWRFTDSALRPAHPLLSPDKWHEVLRTAGFDASAIVPSAVDGHAAIFDQALILARGSGEPAMSRKGPTAPASAWLIFGDGLPAAQLLASALHDRGIEPLVIVADPSHAGRAEESEAVKAALASGVAACTVPITHAVVLGGLAEATAAEEESWFSEILQDNRRALHTIQALISANLPVPPKLWFVTRGAQPLPEGTRDLRGAGLWGMGRVLAVEHPELYGGMVDLDPAQPIAVQVPTLIESLLRPDAEDQSAWRHGDRFVPRLVPQARPAVRPFELHADGSYLITGGLGGIGLHFAHGLAAQGARRIVLAGRTPLPPRSQWADLPSQDRHAESIRRIRALEQLGVSVDVRPVDITDRAQVTALVAGLRSQGALPLRGVIHAAAATDDRLLSQLDVSGLQTAFRAKVLGALVLESCLRDQPLDFFVCCSSIGAVFGQAGQAGYAAANACLDAFASFRRGEGRPMLAVNWGGWSGSGLALTAGGQQTLANLARQGLRCFSPAEGIAALRELLRRDASQAVVIDIDSTLVRGAWSPDGEPPIFRRIVAGAVSAELPRAPLAADAGESTPRADARARLQAAGPGERRALLHEQLTALLAAVLRIEPAAIDPAKPFGNLGLDSLMGVEFKNRCERAFGVTLSATMVWNYPTILTLTGHIAEKLQLSLAETGGPVEVPAARAAGPTDEVIGSIVTDVADMSDDEALQALLRKP